MLERGLASTTPSTPSTTRRTVCRARSSRSSLDAAFRFVDEVDTGQVSVNQPTCGWDVHQPFGGFKESGSPFKEQGLEALRFYTRVKTVAVRTH